MLRMHVLVLVGASGYDGVMNVALLIVTPAPEDCGVHRRVV